MRSKRIATIIPSMTTEVAIETTKIQSVCRLLYDLRCSADCGRDDPSPSELGLAHNGLLFLDEPPEFHAQPSRYYGSYSRAER